MHSHSIRIARAKNCRKKTWFQSRSKSMNKATCPACFGLNASTLAALPLPSCCAQMMLLQCLLLGPWKESCCLFPILQRRCVMQHSESQRLRKAAASGNKGLWNKHRTTVEDEAILHATMQLGTWIYKVKRPLGRVCWNSLPHTCGSMFESRTILLAYMPSHVLALLANPKTKVLKEWKKKDGL